MPVEKIENEKSMPVSGGMEEAMAENSTNRQQEFTCFKEAVCVNAQRIYDSCSDKDCLEDLQVYFSDQTQPIINKAVSVKTKKVKILCVNVDVEAVPFNKGFYSVDMTFYFLVEVAAAMSPGGAPVTVCGIATFNKKVILYGSEAGSKYFSSRSCGNGCCLSEDAAALPEAVVQTVDPVVLASRFCECAEKNCCPGFCIPHCGCQCCELCGDFEDVSASRELYITIGLFTMQWAKIFGAKKVVVIDVLDERLELAKKLGADEGFNATDPDFNEKIKAYTGGQGFGAVYETAGSPATMKMAFELAANRAHVCFIGTPHTDVTFTPKMWENLNRKEFRLVGSWMSYSAPFPGKEWELTAHYFATGELKFDPGFIYRKYPLAEAYDAFMLYKDPSQVHGKIMLINE